MAARPIRFWQRQAVRLDREVGALTPRVQQLSAGRAQPKGLGALSAAILATDSFRHVR